VSAEPSRAIDILSTRFPALLDEEASPLGGRFARGEIVRADGMAWSADDPAVPGDAFWFHRELRDEPEPEDHGDLPILFEDEHLLVIDKPHGVATMPRGEHVRRSALVRLRVQTGIENLSPLHRLDRRTAGVLAYGKVPAERAAFQQLFARGEVDKESRAWVVNGGSPAPEPAPAPADGARTMVPGERFVLHHRLEKTQGILQTQVRNPGNGVEANAVTEVEVIEADPDRAFLRLRPRTGRTHQLRAQLSHIGHPILGDDLYPVVREVGPGAGEMQLLAHRLSFTDPLTGELRQFRSGRVLAGGV
jgi:tRNA pseudouridine32 synthase/23S rRNA pseudouridine746 synthase